jgi:hypothetical protein
MPIVSITSSRVARRALLDGRLGMKRYTTIAANRDRDAKGKKLLRFSVQSFRLSRGARERRERFHRAG